MNIFVNTVYWGVVISISLYLICNYMQKRVKSIFLNPLLFSVVFTILFLLFFKIDYTCYYEKAVYLQYLLTPATVCLAIPLYEQIKLLKKNIKAIILGIISGVFTSMISVLLFCIIFSFSHVMYITLLPKSVTAAIAMGISKELGGLESLTVPIVIMTGITGNMIAEKVCRLFKIHEPIAKGIAIGTASHAMGTVKAIDMGKIEGAMSSLSIAISGIVTVIIATVFSYIY